MQHGYAHAFTTNLIDSPSNTDRLERGWCMSTAF